MLLWLPAAAAPIIIHLWNRRRYREHSWAAMEFLLAAIKKSSRRMRIEQLLLLLLRTAIILLLVMALAKPLVQAIGASLSGGPRTHRVLVIDGSYSMDYRPSGESLFEIAKQKAIEIVEASNVGDGFSLVLMSEDARAVISSAAFDREDVIEEINNLQLPHGGANLLTAVRRADAVVARVRKDNDQLSRSHVYFFTDMGQTTWADSVRSPQQESELRNVMERLNKQGVAEVISLGQGGTSNFAITDLRMTQAFATVKHPVTFEAIVGNWGGQSPTQQLVELYVDGTRVDQQTVQVPPGETSSPVQFRYQFTTAKDHEVEVRISGDSLEVDNRRYLAVPVKEFIKVLCVSGKQDSTLYVALGLDPDHGRPSESIVQPHVVSESGLLDKNLAEYDCIFLCNVAQFTAREAAVLEAQLQRGAGLVFFLGDQVQADRYNRELSRTAGAPRNVLPVVIEETVEADGDDRFFHFDPLDYRHPMLRVWENNERAGLLKAVVAKYFRLAIPAKKTGERGAGDADAAEQDTDRAAAAEATVGLAFDNGDPAIVDGRVGRGRVLVVATAGSTASVMRRDEGVRPWTYIPTGPTFPVIVQQLWKTAVAGRLLDRNVQVFEPIGGHLGAAQADDRISVTLPAFSVPSATQPQVASVTPEADTHAWSFAETDQSGAYRVSQSGSTNEKVFVANVDTQESNLGRINNDELPTGLAARDGGSAEDDETMQVESEGAPVHQAILWLVLALVFTETSFAWWLGNRQI